MPGKNDNLEPVENKKLIFRYLQFALELHEVFSCFFEDLQLRFDASITELDIENETIQIEIEDSFYRQMNNFELGEVNKQGLAIRLSFSAGDILYFCSAKVEKRSGRTLFLKLDFPFYKLQRRNALRIKTVESHGAKISIEGQYFEVLDISATGLSFFTDSEKIVHFPKGKKIKNATLVFLNTDIPVGIDVVSMTKIRGKDIWKIGFKFSSLPKTAEQMIAKEAYLHTHKIWSRWL